MTARFDIQPLATRTNLLLTIDNEAIEKADETGQTNRLLRALRRAKIVMVDTDKEQDISQITIRSHSLARYSDAAHVAVKMLDALYNATDADNAMPKVEMSHDALDQLRCRYGMHVALRWPDRDLDAASRFATVQMQRFANSVNLNGSVRMNTADDMVYVHAVRERGIIIETNPLGSCNISAGGDEYDPAQPVIDLWQHNIYSPQQQLACLMGAVSFATAQLHL